MTGDARRIERFTDLWEPDARGRCWEWQGHLEPNGYGRFYWGSDRPSVWAHRASWELKTGAPIPAGLSVLHSCDNRRCIRPSHLFLGTQADNMADAKAKGRMATGDRSGPRRRDYGTACKNGHARAENSGTLANGRHHYCRPCHATRERLRYQARKAVAA